jgi:CRISPR/Cas system-associated endoribonuclease Cas2
MLYSLAEPQPGRLTVLSYDLASPARARRVRRILEPWHHARQYSVYEMRLTRAEYLKLRQELLDCLDPGADRLAAWWPQDGLRLCWARDRLQVAARDGQPDTGPACLPPRIGDFMVCYDIADPAALRAVGAEVAAEAAMIQRSVYWLRAPLARLTGLLRRCASRLAEADRLWVHALPGHHALWRADAPASALLPISTHHWRTV